MSVHWRTALDARVREADERAAREARRLGSCASCGGFFFHLDGCETPGETIMDAMHDEALNLDSWRAAIWGAK